MYFPFFILHDWGKRSAEARSSHCAVMPQSVLDAVIFGQPTDDIVQRRLISIL